MASHSQVAHAWYHQTGSHRTGCNVFYEGDKIYSYGKHFVLARKLPNNVVLFNSNGYSVSTSKHKSIVRRAIDTSSSMVFDVDNPSANSMKEHVENHNCLYDEAQAEAKRFSRARANKPYIADRIGYFCHTMNLYAAEFDIDVPRNIEVRDFLPAEYADEVDAALQAAEERQRAQRIIEAGIQDALRREHAAKIEDWRNCVPGIRLPYIGGGALLRYVREKDVVETSQSAQFPAKFAPVAWRVISMCRKHGKPWRKNGHRVQLGVYQLDSVDSEGNIRAGCHSVSYEECRYIAGLLGLLDKPQQV